MKINVEFDLTPEEFRQALGLPDGEAFQKDLPNRIRQQMEAGREGYDPMTVMRPCLQRSGVGQGLSRGLAEGRPQGLASFGSYQQMMLDMLKQAGQGAGTRAEAGSTQAESSAGSSGGKASSRGAAKSGAAKKGAASASSRARRDS